MSCPLLDTDLGSLLDADGEPLLDSGDIDTPIVPLLTVISIDTVRLTIRGGNCTGGCWVDLTYQPVHPWHPRRGNQLYLVWPWHWGLPGNPPCRVCIEPQPVAEY